MMWPKEAKTKKNENIKSSRRSAARITGSGKENANENVQSKPARRLEEIDEPNIRGVDKFLRMSCSRNLNKSFAVRSSFGNR